MARNIEIKAVLEDRTGVENAIKQHANYGPETLRQRDVFYRADSGRLKMRSINNADYELIQYNRPDQIEPGLTDCHIFRFSKKERADQMHMVLERSNGVLGIVEKERTLYLIGQTRVHLDRVKGLGHYLELEVVLRENQSLEEGREIANELLDALNISSSCLRKRAYLDYLMEQKSRGRIESVTENKS